MRNHSVKTRWGPGALFVVLLTAGASAGGCRRARAVPLPEGWEHMVVDARFYGDCKAAGDIDGDGRADIVVGRDKLVWYRYPDWAAQVIGHATKELTTDMQLADIDRDGDLDAVVPDGDVGDNVLWFENPGRGAKGPWTRHAIGAHGTWGHDVEVGDIDHDGKVDVVVHQDHTSIFFQDGPARWRKVTVPAPSRGGTALADLNRDGRLDLVHNGVWMETPADRAGTFRPHVFAKGWPDDVSIGVGDLNGDGRVDVVMAPAETAGRLAWFEAPPDAAAATTPWTEHTIEPTVAFVHALKLGDINGDGTLDVIFGEMAQGPMHRVGYLLNRQRGRSWAMTVLSDQGTHNLRVADFGGDGTLDIVGSNWQKPPVSLWRHVAVVAKGARP